MDWYEISTSTHAHQLALFNLKEGDRTVVEKIDLATFQHLSMEFSRGMKTSTPLIQRDHKSPLEFHCQRGHQHTHLQHAVKSFLAYARDAYFAHLKTIDNPKYNGLDVTQLTTLFAKPSHKIRKDVFITDEYACFYFVHANIAHHVRLHITIKRGVAKTYSCDMQIINHHFDLSECGGSDESVDVIHQRLLRLVLPQKNQ